MVSGALAGYLVKVHFDNLAENDVSVSIYESNGPKQLLKDERPLYTSSDVSSRLMSHIP